MKWQARLLFLAAASLGVATAGCGDGAGLHRKADTPGGHSREVPLISGDVTDNLTGFVSGQSENFSGSVAISSTSQGRMRGDRYQMVLISLAVESNIGRQR